MVEQHNPATLVTREQVVCEDERPTRGSEHPAIRVRFERPLFERHVVGWGRAPDDPVVEPSGHDAVVRGRKGPPVERVR